jgi:ribose transport system permease protein
MSTIVSPPPPGKTAAVDESAASFAGRLTKHTSFWMALVVILMIAGFGLASPHFVFWRYDNLVSLSLDATEGLLLAFGMTFLLGAGQMDLSVGANLILSSVLGARTLAALGGTPSQVASGHYPHLALGIVAAIVVALVSGMAFSAVNAFAIIVLRINAFIATLAMTGIGTGIALVITNGIDVPNLPTQLQTNFSGVMLLGVIPAPVLVPIVIGLVLWWVLNRTRFGVHTQAIGSSRPAAQRSGVRVSRTVLKMHLLMGALAAIAGLIDISRFGSTSVAAHTTDALAAIAACVIGGTSLFGGRASIGGSTIGTFIPVVLSSGLIIIGITAFWQQIVVGLILIVAVWIDQRRRKSL